MNTTADIMSRLALEALTDAEFDNVLAACRAERARRWLARHMPSVTPTTPPNLTFDLPISEVSIPGLRRIEMAVRAERLRRIAADLAAEEHYERRLEQMTEDQLAAELARIETAPSTPELVA